MLEMQVTFDALRGETSCHHSQQVTRILVPKIQNADDFPEPLRHNGNGKEGNLEIINSGDDGSDEGESVHLGNSQNSSTIYDKTDEELIQEEEKEFRKMTCYRCGGATYYRQNLGEEVEEITKLDLKNKNDNKLITQSR